MFHRREPDIWIAYADDLKNWYDHKIIMKPIVDSDWEYNKIGIAGPPIKIEQGWFSIYHGTSKDKGYCLGAALLDLNDPSKVLARQHEPILEPELDWEVKGYIPKGVFSCGQAEIGDRILVYYGGADTVIGVAELYKKDIKFG